MKVIIQNKYGGPEVLELVELPKPTINDKEVLVEIHVTNIASGDRRINTLDVPGILKPIMRLVFGWNRPRKKIRGITASGVIQEVGKDITKYKAGDRVYFINSMGAGCLAEYIVLNEKTVMAHIPDGVSFEQAAPIAFGAMSAYHFVNAEQVKKDDKMLIYGASGSVGTYAVQLAKYYGAVVTAVSSKKNHDAMFKIGADHVIDYKTDDFTKQQKKYDVILDAVGLLKKKEAVKALKKQGKFLSLKSLTKEKTERLEILNEIIKEGKLESVIDHSYAFNEYKEAHAHVYTNHKLGNVVIKIKE